MRIGIVALEHPPATGGMERLAHLHIGYLSRRHEVTVHCRADPGEAVHAGARYVPGLSGDEEQDLPRLRETAPDVWLFFNAGLTPYIERLSAPAVAMVHGNDFLKPWAPMLSGAWARRVKLTQTFLGYRNSQKVALHARKRLGAAGLARARRIIAVSQFTKRACEGVIEGPLPPIKVINPGMDQAWLETALKTPRAPADGVLNLLTVSRLERMTKRKNVDGVLDALAAAKELSFRYTVIGQGDDRERLIAHAARLGLADRVSFPGRVPDEALQEAYAAADLFVMPVQSDGRDVEGFGMVFTEAAAYGTPSLATRHGGIPDAILEGVSGMLLDTADPAAIAKGLRTFSLNRAAFDPEKIRAFARTFGIDNVAPQVERVLIEAAA